MRHAGIVFLLCLLLDSVSFARQSQFSSSMSPASQTQIPVPVNSAFDCGGSLEALRLAKQPWRDGIRAHTATDDLSRAPELNERPSPVADPDEDLTLLEESRKQIAGCILATNLDAQPGDSLGRCSAEVLFNFEMRHEGEPERDIPIARLAGTTAFFYESGMTIDADGAPNAYHPDNLGLDDLSNAGSPGQWYGLAKDGNGEPLIQGPDDPFPGYYVSETALADRSKPVSDPTRYVDASKIPFVVLPGGMARELGARPGDFAVAFNRRNGKSSYAIFGDVGPFDRIGEGSMALAENLGIRSDPRNGGARRGIVFMIFPGSGNRQPRTAEEIRSEGQKLLQDWESSISLEACAAPKSEREFEGN